MPTRSRAKVEANEDTGEATTHTAEEWVVDEIEAGEGSVEAAPRGGGKGPMYVWPAPGYVIVRELSGQEAGIGGDMSIGEVAIPHPELAAYYPEGIPLLYPSRKTPTIAISGKTYAVLNVEDVMGVASRDQNVMERFRQGQEAQYARQGYDEREPEPDYRQSSNVSSPGMTNSSSGSPFEEFKGY